jgi:hypothetical protein
MFEHQKEILYLHIQGQYIYCMSLNHWVYTTASDFFARDQRSRDPLQVYCLSMGSVLKNYTTVFTKCFHKFGPIHGALEGKQEHY